MAQATTTVNAQDALPRLTVTVRVTWAASAFARLRAGTALLRLAAWVGGFKVLAVDSDDAPIPCPEDTLAAALRKRRAMEER